jgi:hypothetical protein
MIPVTGESWLWADSDHSYRASNERESDRNKRKQSFHGCTSPKGQQNSTAANINLINL